MSRFATLAAIAVCLSLIGCAQYATPGAGTRMNVFMSPAAKDAQSDSSVVQAMNKRPLAKLPASVAVVRVQAPGYTSATAEGWGQGAYSVVTTQDIDGEEAAMERLAKLPMINGLAPINRLLLPTQLNSDLEMRRALSTPTCS